MFGDSRVIRDMCGGGRRTQGWGEQLVENPDRPSGRGCLRGLGDRSVFRGGSLPRRARSRRSHRVALARRGGKLTDQDSKATGEAENPARATGSQSAAGHAPNA